MANKVCGKCSELDEQGIQIRHKLYEQYIAPNHDVIYKLCKKYSFHSSHVDENYNEVLINFYLRVETYNPAKPLKTWLHIVTKRCVMEQESKRSKNSFDDLDDSYELIAEQNEPRITDMDISNYRSMYSDDVLRCLDAMNPNFKRALLLQESGYPLKEIAELEGISIGTIKCRIYHARQFLKNNLDNGKYNKKD